MGVGLIPSALLWASNEATVFFFGFDTPRPRFLGLPSLWWVVLALSLSSLPLLGRCGESAAANSCANEGLGDAGTGTEFCGTLRGFGPGFLLAIQNWFDSAIYTKFIQINYKKKEEFIREMKIRIGEEGALKTE